MGACPMTHAIFTPESTEQACQLVADARAKGTVLSPMGNGSKSGIGQLHDGPVQPISANALTGITQYNPAELVVVAKAGTAMAEVEAALDENNQRLIFEPANWSGLTGKNIDQTIGGIAATNMSGPRRYALGAARDSLLGVKFINGLGEEIKNGGQVMKNVTGLDLVKLLGGSWGTLGLLTEVSFKVLPKVETERTLVAHGLSDADAAKLMANAMATSTDVTGAAHIPDSMSIGLDDSGATLLRLEGLAGSVKDRIVRLRAALSDAQLTELDEKKSADVWAHIRDVKPFCDGTQTPVWRISVAPMAGHKVVADIAAKTDCDAFYDWQGGLVWLRINDADDAVAATVRGAVASHGGGHALLVRASDDLRRTVPVFQPEPLPIQALNARIRTAIDPDGVFDASRMLPPHDARAA